MSRGRAVLLGAVACGLVVGTSALTALAKHVDPVAWCQVRLSVMGRKFFREWSGEISLCEQRVMKGDSPTTSVCYPDEMIRNDPSTFCRPSDDPNVDENYQQRLCRAEQHSHEKIARKCTDGYLAQIELGVPCGTVATVAQLQDCIDFDAHGQNAADFTRAVYGHMGRVDNTELRDCIVTIFSAGQIYARKVMQIMGDKCEVSVRQGKIPPPCPDRLAQKRLRTARQGFAKAVLSTCESELTGHLVPFGPPCDNLINPTPSDYIDCLTSAAENLGMRGVSTVWPGI